MTSTVTAARRPRRATASFSEWLPRLLLGPSFAAVLLFVYGFILFTAYLSLTNSRMLPVFQITGFDAYFRLFAQPNWTKALSNLAIFASLYMGLSIAIGLALAIFLDQKVRIEGVLRPIYLYPMAISFIVTGTAWKWFLNPTLGLEKTMYQLGWTSFSFDWLVNPQMALYTVVIAGVWQVTGFVMALFLAGLRGVDAEIFKAAQVDGASRFNIYTRIVIPMLRPVLFSAVIVLAHMAIKSYDLVVALTGGGPGNATELPSTFMYSYTFTRNQMAVGSASAIVMLIATAIIMIPYLRAETKETGR